MKSIQESVGAWHIATFGTDCSNKRIARKLLEESAEFMVANSTATCVENRAEEAADVLLVLMAWAHRNHVDLIAEVQKKFDIVRSRDQRQRDE